MLLDADESQLLLIDYQEKLMPALHDGPMVLANALLLVQVAAMVDVPVWGTEHYPQGLGPTVPVLRDSYQRTLSKMHFSAVTDGVVEVLRPPARPQSRGGNARSLPRHLQKPAPSEEAGRNTVVLAGCEAHVCLLQTALELLEQEFDVWVVTDACTSRTERSRDAAFDRLAGAGAELVTTEMVGFEWLRSAEHPDFKDWLALIK